MERTRSGGKINGRIRREQIIQATLTVIAQRGVSSLTTAAIAKQVGISEASLYRHFKNKDEILFETGKGIGETVSKKLDLVFKTTARPIVKLKKIFLLHLAFIEKNAGVPRLAFSEEMHIGNPKLQKLLLRNLGDYAFRVETLIREGQQDESLRADIDPKASAAMFTGMVMISVMHWSLSGFSFP